MVYNTMPFAFQDCVMPLKPLKKVVAKRLSGADLGAGKPKKPLGPLALRFRYPPLTVLNARDRFWQNRKREWLEFGIRGEEGRANDTTGTGDEGKCYNSGSPGDLSKGFKKKVQLAPGSGGSGCWLNGKVTESTANYRDNPKGGAGTSIYDPVLCELLYHWFCPPRGKLLDPFAGGSTRGIVAAARGYDYTGIELRKQQVAANERQAEFCGLSPTWVAGDSARMKEFIPNEEAFDASILCPPYYNLEIYSDEDTDGSAFDSYETFLVWYKRILRQTANRLKENRFMAATVGEVRDERGVYRNFVGDTVRILTELGLHYWNELILVTAVGSLPIRVGQQFSNSRKAGKSHQNIVVFWKGEPKQVVPHIHRWFPDERKEKPNGDRKHLSAQSEEGASE